MSDILSQRVLRVPAGSELISTNPHDINNAASRMVCHQIHRGLFRRLPGGAWVDDLVEMMDIDLDGRNMRVRLGEHRFSDGTPLRAKHVVQSFARLIWEDTPAGRQLDTLQGYVSFKETGDEQRLGVVASSDREVLLMFHRQAYYFYTLLAGVEYSILPIDDYRQWQGDTSIGLGPYRWMAADQSLLRWREDVRDALCPPERVELVRGDPVVAAFEGRVDTIEAVGISEDVRSKLVEEKWRQCANNDSGLHYFVMNPQRASLATRHWLSFQVLPDDLMTEFSGLTSISPLYGMLPVGSGVFSLKEKPPLIESVQAPPTKPIEVLFDPMHPIHTRLVGYLRRVWHAAPIVWKEMGRDDILSAVERGDFCAAIYSWDSEYFEGFSILKRFQSNHPRNHFCIAEENVDQDIYDLFFLSDSGDDNRYIKLQKKLLSYRTVIPLVSGTLSSGLWGPRVRIVPYHRSSFFSFPFEVVEMSSVVVGG